MSKRYCVTVGRGYTKFLDADNLTSTDVRKLLATILELMDRGMNNPVITIEYYEPEEVDICAEE